MSLNKILPTEQQEQMKLHQWCKLKGLLSFSIPNGGTRHKLEAINLKKEGLTKGVSDYCVVLKDVVLFIEMKRQKKVLKSGKLSISHTKTSLDQLNFLEDINKSKACKGVVAYGFKEAKEFIEECL